MRLLLLFVICSFSVFAQEEGMPFAHEELLLKSDIIVLAKTRSDQGKTFKAEILEVIQDKRFGLKVGDYLLIKDNVTLGCGFIENVTQEIDTAIFVLQKGTNNWEFANSDFIPSFVNGIANMYFMGCNYSANAEKFTSDLRDFLVEFHLDEKGHVVTSDRLSKDITPELSDLVLHCYLMNQPSLLASIPSPLTCMLHSEENNLPSEPIVDNEVYEILDTKPVPILGLNELIMEVSEKTTAYMYSLGIFFEGTIYVELIIEKDGSVSFAKTKKGIVEHLDLKGEELLLETKWNQGLDGSRQPKRCRTVFPIKLG
jgi:hypothetical protein